LGFHLEIVQRCSTAFAFIRLDSPIDRDWLVNHSPFNINGREVSGSRHDAGINHRHIQYNADRWLMLMAFPLDLWATQHIKGVVKDFATLLVWDDIASNYRRIIIKVRITAANKVPYSCVVSSPDGSESWSVPIFILSQHQFGFPPADEDIPHQIEALLILYQI
jgi:hypothetical protein